MVEIPVELRQQYRKEKLEVEDRLLAMGGTVLELLRSATAALQDRDRERAEEVRRADGRLDDESRVLQDAILRLVALQAPVASELRTVALYLYVNIHLERMSDLCRNVARAAAEAQLDEDALVRAQIQEMSRHAARVIETALQAFAQRDADLARSLPGLDHPLDVLNRSIFRRTAELISGEGDFEWAMRLVLVARYIERMADHAVDIGEQIIYAVTGRMESLD